MSPTARTGACVGLFHIAETREEARKNVQFGVQAFANYFRDIATFPIIPPDVGDPTEWLIETGTGMHRYAGRRDRLYRAAGRGLRRVWRALRTGAELGRLGRDQKALRADGALCPSAFPEEPRFAARQLRLRHEHVTKTSPGRRVRRSRPRSTATPTSARGRRPNRRATAARG